MPTRSPRRIFVWSGVFMNDLRIFINASGASAPAGTA
jgi:hypothetical protein